VSVDGLETRSTGARIGAIVFWICFLLALLGVVSALMWIAAGEPDERWRAAGGWALFAVAAYVVGRVVRWALSKPRRNGTATAD